MNSFGKIRSVFWPVHRFELKRVLPLLFMYSLIAFCYGVLRNCKDSMVVTASGAEAIAFIKVWAILPSALLLTLLFTRLSSRYTKEKVFYIMMGIFLSFFFVFTFVLYPAQEVLHPHRFADSLQGALPQGLKGLVSVFRNWTFTLFYVMSELWGTAILSVLFWGFANEVTKVSEAKRFYVIWTIGANVAGIFAGQFAVFLSKSIYLPWIRYGANAWDQSVLFVNTLVIIAGIGTLFLFRYVAKMTPEREEIAKKATKIKMSMKENFSYLLKSRYLLYIAAIVLAYNLSINLIEIVWKNQMRELYPSPSEYNGCMGSVMTWMSILATVISIVATFGNVLKRFSWTSVALVTPLIALAAGSLFFLFVLSGQLGYAGSFLGMTPLALSVMLGSVHNGMTRACKHTLFDATKEMSFIPLDSESKLKGKAAIDGVGSRLGKSGGSVIHQGLLLLLGSVGASAPYVAAIFLGVVVIWVISLKALGRQFDALSSKKEEASPVDA